MTSSSHPLITLPNISSTSAVQMPKCPPRRHNLHARAAFPPPPFTDACKLYLSLFPRLLPGQSSLPIYYSINTMNSSTLQPLSITIQQYSNIQHPRITYHAYHTANRPQPRRLFEFAISLQLSYILEYLISPHLISPQPPLPSPAVTIKGKIPCKSDYNTRPPHCSIFCSL